MKEHPYAKEYINNSPDPMPVIITMEGGHVTGCYIYTDDIRDAIIEAMSKASGVNPQTILSKLEAGGHWQNWDVTVREIVLWQLESGVG